VPELVHLERRDDGLAVVTLDHPKVNALSSRLLDELRDVARGLSDEPPRAVLVTGGPKVFAAGADISEFAGPEEARRVGTSFLDALEAVAAIPRVTIAAIGGYALGGGCELALSCDLRIASARARLGQPEILLGIIPGGGGTQRLARLIGPARAKDLIFSGRQVTAEEALRIGLVDRVVPAEGFEEAALAWATELAAGPSAVAGLAKQAIDRGLDMDLADGLRLEQDLFVESFRSEDSQLGVESFREHGPGKATFTGR
jgi:enoyl-CoA hydratase/carnithine racemase